jgi:hypothetical protein
MALICDQGNEALWHEVFETNLDRYTDKWLYVHSYFQEQLLTTLPPDVLYRVLSDLIEQANEHLAGVEGRIDYDGIAEKLNEAIALFDGESEE